MTFKLPLFINVRNIKKIIIKLESAFKAESLIFYILHTCVANVYNISIEKIVIKLMLMADKSCLNDI